jgi:hypothetical protein
MRPLAIRSRMIQERWGPLVLPVVALLGSMGLFSFARHVWDAGASRDEPPGLTIRTEIRTIYAPKGMNPPARLHRQRWHDDGQWLHHHPEHRTYEAPNSRRKPTSGVQAVRHALSRITSPFPVGPETRPQQR